MKKIILSLLLSLPISTFAFWVDDWQNPPSQEEENRAQMIKLKKSAQCLRALELVKASTDAKKKICDSYRGKTGKHSACATVCQYVETLDKEKSSK